MNAHPAHAAVARLRNVILSGVSSLLVFTFVVDVLLLVQPLYMIQVYDRVLASQSIETLVFISIIAAAALLLLAVVDSLRAMIAGRLAARMDVVAGPDTLLAAMSGPKASLGDVQPLRDLATVRGFISNRGILAYLDLPFAPLFIGLLYFIHPDLFWMTVLGAAVLALLAIVNQIMANRAANAGGDQAVNAMLSAQSFARNAESIGAMGMTDNLIQAWGRDEAQSLAVQDRTNSINATFAGISRMLRLGLQIAILGYGSYLVVVGEMTAGMIFAASLISGRGLQPIDQVIAGWKGFVETRKAWARWKTAMAREEGSQPKTELPAPSGRIKFDQVVVFPANAQTAEPLLKRISLEIAAGDFVAVIGASGAGKSTFVRALVGAVPIRGGAVRIDEADIRTWRKESLGRHVGYLSQDIDLLPGTIAQNIGRFDPGAEDAEIIDAATRAQVHDLVVGLPKGYDTMIGPFGHQLSGGQRQRIGLARAFYGRPRILVLDEPNASLDAEGEAALQRAVAQARADGATIIVVTQRRQITEQADKILILRDGAIEDFGARADVFKRQSEKLVAEQARRAAAPAAPQAQAAAARLGRVTTIRPTAAG